jgi:hypothetical protein
METEMKKNQDAAETQAIEVLANRTMQYHSQHPKVGVASRVSYTIPGIPGNLVIFLSMFKDGIAPPTLTLDCDLALPKADNKTAKAEAAAAKAQERSDKAAARVAAAAEKLEAKRLKAEEALAAAKAKVAEAEVVTA